MKKKNKKRKYSDWQRDRLRDALRAFHQYEHVEDYSYYEAIGSSEDEDGRENLKRKKEEGQQKMKTYLTWADSHAAIAEYTGVEVGRHKDERKRGNLLQKFVEGVNDPENPGEKVKYEPKNEWVEAIAAFLTHEDIDLLSQDELNEYVPGVQAPMRMVEYLSKNCINKMSVSPSMFEGVYQARKVFDEIFFIIELTLQSSMENGLIQVVEIKKFYDKKVSDSFGKYSYQERQDNLISVSQHGGWAVVTPEDTLMFFMKNKTNGNNHSYYSIAPDFEVSFFVQRYLILAMHDYHIKTGLESGTDHLDDALNEVCLEKNKDIFMFQIVSPQ